jgi:hypothetical protein
MNSHTYDYDYIDGNAAAGELSNIFAMDVTAAKGQCAHCGAKSALLRHMYTCKVPVSWRGAPFASTYSFVL